MKTTRILAILFTVLFVLLFAVGGHKLAAVYIVMAALCGYLDLDWKWFTALTVLFLLVMQFGQA